MVDLVIKIFLLITPLAYWQGEQLNNFDIKLMHIIPICLFIASFFDKPIRYVYGKKYLALLLGGGILSFFIHDLNIYIMNHNINLFLLSFSYCLIVIYCKDYKSMYKYMILGVILNSIYLISQKLGFDPLPFAFPKSHPGGMLGNSPRFSTYLCLLLPCIFTFNIFLFFGCIGLSLWGDPQCAILGVATIVLFFNSKNLTSRLFVIVCAILGVFFLYDHLFESIIVRGKIWANSLEILFSNPFMGVGAGIHPGGINFVNKAGFDGMICSSLLQFVIGYGITSIIFLYFLFKNFFSNIDLENIGKEEITIISLIFLSTIEYPLEIKRLFFTITAILAFYSIKQINIKTKERMDYV